MTDPVETKLAAARTKLILDMPFFGALALRLPIKEAPDDWCKTTATDARAFYYNRGFIDALTLSETQFMLAHEALHCGLSHFARRQHRVKHRWDLACDLAINPLLVECGLKAPPGSLMMEQYQGMTAEEIYPLLEELDHKETLDQHLYDQENKNSGASSGNRNDPSAGGGGGSGQGQDPHQGGGASPEQSGQGEGQGRGSRTDSATGQDRPGSGQGEPPPPPMTPDERETLGIQWQQRLAGAAQQARMAGKLGGTLARLIEHLMQPQLPWRNLLARHLVETARDDFSYQRPSRREGEFILPSLRSHEVDVVVAIDTSASIHDEEFAEFLAEINALKGQIRARVTLLPCDAALAPGAPWIWEPWEEARLPERFKGKGGTDFQPVFDWVERRGLRPQVLVYFTDADAAFPARAPDYPVVWLVKGRRPTPWGQRIQLN